MKTKIGQTEKNVKVFEEDWAWLQNLRTHKRLRSMALAFREVRQKYKG